MKIAIAQMDIIPAQPKKNAERMVKLIRDAYTKDLDLDMIVFPELTIPGYLIGDTWEEQSFLDECKEAEKFLRIAAKFSGLYIVFGNVCVGEGTQHDGRVKKYNGLIIASPFRNEENLGYLQDRHGDWFIPKYLLPNYREFDEPRHFSCLTDPSLIRPLTLTKKWGINGSAPEFIKIGFALCEDGWDADYDIKVTKILADKGAELLINCSCSPFTMGKNEKRNRVFGGHAKQNGINLIYCNAVGCQNNGKGVFTFDGCSVVYNKNGDVVNELGLFEENVMIYDTDVEYNTPIKIIENDLDDVYRALVYGIKKFCEQSGIDNVVIGASGGVDSAVSASLHCAALGPEHVFLVNMPSKYNSETTKGLAYDLANNLGCKYSVVPIQDSVDLTKNQIDGLEFVDENSKIAVILSAFNMENVQARDRSSRILAAVASGLPGRTAFTNNGNKSEGVVGYCTIYGDTCGYMCAIGDLWKAEGEVNVYSIGRYINKLAGREVIPEGTLTIVASAELSDAQNVDEGKGDPIVYWYHDRLFKSWIQDWNRKTPEDIIKWYIDGTINEKLNLPKDINELFRTPEEFVNDLERWWKMFKNSVFKRVQMPPILCLTKRSLGGDYRESLNCCLFTTKYNRLKAQLLEKEG